MGWAPGIERSCNGVCSVGAWVCARQPGGAGATPDAAESAGRAPASNRGREGAVAAPAGSAF